MEVAKTDGSGMNLWHDGLFNSLPCTCRLPRRPLPCIGINQTPFNPPSRHRSFPFLLFHSSLSLRDAPSPDHNEVHRRPCPRRRSHRRLCLHQRRTLRSWIAPQRTRKACYPRAGYVPLTRIMTWLLTPPSCSPRLSFWYFTVQHWPSQVLQLFGECWQQRRN